VLVAEVEFGEAAAASSAIHEAEDRAAVDKAAVELTAATARALHSGRGRKAVKSMMAEQLRRMAASLEQETLEDEDVSLIQLDDSDPWEAQPEASAIGPQASDPRALLELGDDASASPDPNAALPFISALGSFTSKSYRAWNETSAEVSDKDAKILTPKVMEVIKQSVYPSFSGATQYFTGQTVAGQADGTAFPGPSAVGNGPGTLGFVANLAPLRIQNKVIWDMLYAADNEKGSSSTNKTNSAGNFPVTNEVHPLGFGKVRSIDPGTGFIKSLKEFDKIDWDQKKTRSIFAVAAHSFMVNKTRTSFVYAAIENNGIFQLDLNSKKMKMMRMPKGPDGKKHIWEKGYRDVCITAPVSADAEEGTSMLFLHYKKVVYALDASKCTEDEEECNLRQITDYTHHEGFMKSMACASHTYKSEGDKKYSLFLTQRGGKNVVKLDLSDSLKVKGATVRADIVAAATGKSVDGATPSFVKFQGIGVYAPKWAKAAEPYVLLSGGGELRVLDYTNKYVHTLAHTENGAVAALGDDAFSGNHRIFKTDLNNQVKCDALNSYVLPMLVRWKIQSDLAFAKEVRTVQLKLGTANSPWIFKAYKKTANTINGVLEKAMVCSRQADKGINYFDEHCCMLKFSRAVQGKHWTEQGDETELF
jgi:hypothetical protein